MTESFCSFTVAGVPVQGDINGALYLPEAETLVVSDLHFEKGSAFAAKGVLLPPFDTRAALTRLELSIARFRPRTVIALGDSFHDEGAGARIAADDWARIGALTSAHAFIWITGNHDEELPEGIDGIIEPEVHYGCLDFRHEPEPGVAAEVAGHLHPCATVRTRSRHLRRRCFVGDGARLIMPAFGAFTGGLDIADKAYAGMFRGPITAWVLGTAQVFAIPEDKLAGVA